MTLRTPPTAVRSAVPRLARRGLLAAASGLVLLPALRPARAATPTVERSRKIAPSLYEIAVSAARDTVYVASVGTRGGNDAALVALDPRTLEEKGRIALAEPGFGLGLNDRTQMAYATNTRSGSVSAIDLKAGTVVARIAHGEGAHLRQAVVDEAANRIYVTAFGARDKPSAIWVIDGAANRIDHVLEAGLEQGGITGLALDAGRGRLFATALGSNEVVEIDVAGRRVLRRFASGGEGAVNVALDPAQNRLFVTNQKSGTLTVLDAGSGAVVGSLPTGDGALGVTFSPSNGLVFVTNRRAGTTSVVDGKGLSILASLPTGTHPNTVAVDHRNGAAYVSNKAKTGERGAPPPDDPNGDTVSLIRI
ncbi:YncE family protein [Roseomonas sp. OT10]|uniref:YncE family protein n=1 Tax=Roseomonas cutis TaxID=2897332 RepID=UPI001E28E6FF|nr:YncE family protein [Roseomonas sp. OT10]UFN47552.1 YncE family protein [Roseomonas sp. OT10]